MLSVLLAMAAAGAYALPAAALLLRSHRPWGAPGRAAAAALALVWSVNFATVLWGAGWDSLGWFLAINLGFFGSAGASLAGVSLVGVLIRRPVRGRELGLWVTAGFGFWLVGLYLALVVEDGDFSDAFGVATAFVALAAVFAGIRILGQRKNLPVQDRTASVVFLALIIVLLGLGLWNDVAGLHWPLSPVFLVLGATAVYRVEFGRLPVTGPDVASPDSWCRNQGISVREQEVLALVAGGVDRAVIAQRLFISPVTVKNHLASLYRKTATSDLQSLATLAREAGLGSPTQPV